MQVIAGRSQASCKSFLTVRRVTRVEARRSTALVLTRTDSTHSKLSEVPRLTWSGRPASTAMAVGSDSDSWMAELWVPRLVGGMSEAITKLRVNLAAGIEKRE